MLFPQRLYLTHSRVRPQLPLKQLRAIVIHWTANENKGANALANRSYFNQGFRAASAHYIVDDHAIIQCLPDKEVGYHCGDRPLGRYKKHGLELMKGYGRTTPNFFTIGVEMCVNLDGDWNKTYQHTVELVARLILAHKLPPGALFRHFDITGKACPKPFLDSHKWAAFVNDVTAEITRLIHGGCHVGVVLPETLNVRPNPGDLQSLRGQLDQNDPVVWTIEYGDWGMIAENSWINLKFVKRISQS